jgi:hypothetical protein
MKSDGKRSSRFRSQRSSSGSWSFASATSCSTRILLSWFDRPCAQSATRYGPQRPFEVAICDLKAQPRVSRAHHKERVCRSAECVCGLASRPLSWASRTPAQEGHDLWLQQVDPGDATGQWACLLWRPAAPRRERGSLKRELLEHVGDHQAVDRKTPGPRCLRCSGSCWSAGYP